MRDIHLRKVARQGKNLRSVESIVLCILRNDKLSQSPLATDARRRILVVISDTVHQLLQVSQIYHQIKNHSESAIGTYPNTSWRTVGSADKSWPTSCISTAVRIIWNIFPPDLLSLSLSLSLSICLVPVCAIFVSVRLSVHFCSLCHSRCLVVSLFIVYF